MFWPEILLLCILFLAILHVVGHPLLKILEKVHGIDQSIAKLDFVQKLPLEFALAGAIIYIWALIATPFHLFNEITSFILIAFFGLLYFFQYLREKATKHSILEAWARLPKFSYLAFGGFIFGLLLRVIPLGALTLGSVVDTSLHTLFVYSIIRDGGIPLSVIPGAVLQVPQGVHVVMAFFSMVTGSPPELVVFYELAYFNATIVLAMYTFSSLLVSREYAFIVEALVAGISAYPIVVTWGAHWIPWALTIFFAFFALVVPRFIDQGSTSSGATKNLRALIVPGVLLGYIGGTYPPLYALSILIVFLLIVAGRRQIVMRSVYLLISFLVSLPLVALWAYRLYAYSNYASQFVLQQQTLVQYVTSYDAALRWFPYRDLLSLTTISGVVYRWSAWEYILGWPGTNFVFTGLMIIGAAILLLIAFSKSRRLLPSNLSKYLFASIFAMLIWGLDSPLGLVFSSSGILGIMASELDKQYIIAGTILIPFIASLPIYGFLILIDRGVIPWRSLRKWATAFIVIFLVIANLALVQSSVTWLVANYGVYATSNNSDYELLQWMKTGIPNNASVLVNPFDAGQYVPSIADKPTVGISSTGIFFLDPTYKEAWQMMYDGSMNSTVLSLIKSLNVSYVYVGNYAFQGGWSPHLFLDHRFDFRLVKNFGTSYLFKVIIPNTNNMTTFGVVSNEGLIGISDNRTLVDFQDMVTYNIVTGSSKYFEIGLAYPNGSYTEIFNHSNAPTNVSLIFENSTYSQFALSGSNGTALVSAVPVLNQYTNFTVAYGGAFTALEFGIQPVANVIQEYIGVGSLTNTTWSIGLEGRDKSYFALSPRNGTALAFSNQTLSLSASGGSVSFTLSTLSIPKQNSSSVIFSNFGTSRHRG